VIPIANRVFVVQGTRRPRADDEFVHCWGLDHSVFPLWQLRNGGQEPTTPLGTVEVWPSTVRLPARQGSCELQRKFYIAIWVQGHSVSSVVASAQRRPRADEFPLVLVDGGGQGRRHSHLHGRRQPWAGNCVVLVLSGTFRKYAPIVTLSS
jgi:hypothetical protein